MAKLSGRTRTDFDNIWDRIEKIVEMPTGLNDPNPSQHLYSSGIRSITSLDGPNMMTEDERKVPPAHTKPTALRPSPTIPWRESSTLQ
ncbi:MAG: hypothetical protein KAW09_05230 [Thermoplasmata archaeon]|nr:hypothetical protein [Thermoplasmata archaeon]